MYSMANFVAGSSRSKVKYILNNSAGLELCEGQREQEGGRGKEEREQEGERESERERERDQQHVNHLFLFLSLHLVSVHQPLR